MSNFNKLSTLPEINGEGDGKPKKSYESDPDNRRVSIERRSAKSDISYGPKPKKSYALGSNDGLKRIEKVGLACQKLSQSTKELLSKFEHSAKAETIPTPSLDKFDSKIKHIDRLLHRTRGIKQDVDCTIRRHTTKTSIRQRKSSNSSSESFDFESRLSSLSSRQDGSFECENKLLQIRNSTNAIASTLNMLVPDKDKKLKSVDASKANNQGSHHKRVSAGTKSNTGGSSGATQEKKTERLRLSTKNEVIIHEIGQSNGAAAGTKTNSRGARGSSYNYGSSRRHSRKTFTKESEDNRRTMAEMMENDVSRTDNFIKVSERWSKDSVNKQGKRLMQMLRNPHHDAETIKIIMKKTSAEWTYLINSCR